MRSIAIMKEVSGGTGVDSTIRRSNHLRYTPTEKFQPETDRLPPSSSNSPSNKTSTTQSGASGGASNKSDASKSGKMGHFSAAVTNRSNTTAPLTTMASKVHFQLKSDAPLTIHVDIGSSSSSSSNSSSSSSSGSANVGHSKSNRGSHST
eukprot:Filipodium_phascolosomae@DN8719_c0_g1_i1.p1